MPDDTSTDALPATEPHSAPIFDTGPHPQPLPGPPAAWSRSGAGADAAGRVSPVALAETGPDDPRREPVVPGSPASVVVAGRYHFLKWWQLVLVLAAVWIPAAGVGLGLFSWWYQLLDKTPAIFVTLVYVVVCTVAGLMLAMVRDKPLVSALAIAVLSAVFAAALGAAPLYGYYFCQVQSPCLAGIIPY